MTEMLGALKRYGSYPVAEKCGVRCHVHKTVGDYPLHRHDYIEIEYLADGGIEHKLNGSRQALTRGDFYLLGTQDLHHFSVPDSVVIHNLCIDYRKAPPALRQLLAGISLPMSGHLDAERLDALSEHFSVLSSLITEDVPYAEERIAAHTLLFVTALLESAHPAADKKPPTGYGHVRRAMDYIDAHYGEDISITDVASAAYLSPAHFSRLFTRINGSSFSEYLSHLRIEKAEAALLDGDRSITEIALSVGFGSFPTFSRAFRRYLGCTPSQYRAKAKRD